jgi:peptidoglycan/LPS O-acetylase OafA/YrhL
MSAIAKKALLQIPSLDGLRALSFLIVFLAHAGVAAIPGGFGVTVFFFLSGYLITTLMRIEAEKRGRVNFKLFYLRRAVRILPPFYLVLFAFTALAATPIIDESLKPSAVLAQALHYSNYFIAFNDWNGQAPGTGVYWSLAVEEHFYFVFPALYVTLRALGLHGRGQAFALWGICVAVLVWRIVLVIGLDATLERTYVCTDTRADSMLFGCALAVHSNPSMDRPNEGASPLMRLVLLPLSLAALVATFVLRDNTFRETLRYSVQGMALYPIFIVAIRNPAWGPFRILNWRPVAYVGTLSYSLYLVHHFVIFMVGRFLPAPGGVRGGVALAVSLGLAMLIFKFVEKPFALVRKRFASDA